MLSFIKKEVLPVQESALEELSDEELSQVVAGSSNCWGWHHHYHSHHHYGHWEWKKLWEPVWAKVWEPGWGWGWGWH